MVGIRGQGNGCACQGNGCTLCGGGREIRKSVKTFEPEKKKEIKHLQDSLTWLC